MTGTRDYSIEAMDDTEIEQARSRLVKQLRDRGHLYSNRVTKAMEIVPRYEDEPLAIGREQVTTAPHSWHR